MSSSVEDRQYMFDAIDSGEQSFIYGLREDSYDDIEFMGALEADTDIIIDLESREGLYRPGLDDSDLATAVGRIHEFAEEQGLDTYNITFTEPRSASWRSTIADIWRNLEGDRVEDLKHSEANSTQEQLADGGSTAQPVEGHSRVGQAETIPIGTVNSQDEYRFDASEGWDWS